MTTRNDPARGDEPELNPRDDDRRDVPTEPDVPVVIDRGGLRDFRHLGRTRFDRPEAREGEVPPEPTRYQTARQDAERAGNKPDALVSVRQDTLLALLDLAPLYAYPLMLTEKRPLEVPGPYAAERLNFLDTAPVVEPPPPEGGEGDVLENRLPEPEVEAEGERGARGRYGHR
jgi:hypothetical protein